VLLENCYKLDPRESKWLLAAIYALHGYKHKAADVLTKYMKSKSYNDYTVDKVLKYDGFMRSRSQETRSFFPKGCTSN